VSDASPDKLRFGTDLYWAVSYGGKIVGLSRLFTFQNATEISAFANKLVVRGLGTSLLRLHGFSSTLRFCLS